MGDFNLDINDTRKKNTVNEIELLFLKDIINNINPDIQSTSEHSKEEILFLDILIKKQWIK